MEQAQEHEKANGRVGLANLGQTCYINAVVQSLRYSPELANYLINEKHKAHLKMDRVSAPVVAEMADVIKSMWTADVRFKATMAPRGFINAITRASRDRDFSILSGDQADAGELLQFLIESLHSGVARSVKMDVVGIPKSQLDELHIKSLESWSAFHAKEYSPIIDHFYGQTLTTMTCQRCKSKSNTFEPWVMLKVPVKKEKGSISDCITEFLEPETLPDYRCTKCGEDTKGPALKEHTISRLPSNIIIQFKRFQNNGSKVRSKVDINIEATNMTQWLSFPGVSRNTNPVYTTYAIVEHHGSSRGGHYINYSRHGSGWLCYDDQNIYPVSSDKVVNDDTYILFMTNKPHELEWIK
jgi:ubiquitin C-terminal hydrolase